MQFAMWLASAQRSMSAVQQAEVAELMRRAQHAEQENAAARAEATAMRRSADRDRAERAAMQYAAVRNSLGSLQADPDQVEFDPLPAMGSR